MKRIALIVLIAAMTATIAKGNYHHENDYLVTKNDTVFCDEVREGLTSIIAKTSEGVKKYKPAEVKMYLTGQNFYVRHKLPEKDKEVFMELVAHKWDLRLFKYNRYTGATIDVNGRISRNSERYLVYKKGKFNVEVDEKNADHLLGVFGLK